MLVAGLEPARGCPRGILSPVKPLEPNSTKCTLLAPFACVNTLIYKEF